MWLPGPFEIVCQARIDPWVEEDQQRAMSRRCSNQFAVAALNDPGSVGINEVAKGSCDSFIRALQLPCRRLGGDRAFQHSNLAGLPKPPNNRVRVKVSQALSRGKGACIRALSGARVAEDENFHVA
jgi:hypothetical protein